jgi:fibronectin-binding autotransporter adhesin
LEFTGTDAVYMLEPNQFGEGALVNFNQLGKDMWNFLSLDGHSQTVGGLISGDPNNRATIGTGNIMASVGNETFPTATLTVNVAEGEEYYFHGYMRHMNNNGTTSGLAFVKDGLGTQVLANGIMIRSGIEVKQGILEFYNLSNDAKYGFTNTTITIRKGATLKFVNTTLNGDGKTGVRYTGAGTLIVDNTYLATQQGSVAMEKGGLIIICNGTGSNGIVGWGNNNNGTNWTENKATIRILTKGILDLRDNAVTMGGLEGDDTGNITNSAGRIGTTSYLGDTMTIGNGTLAGETFTYNGKFSAGPNTTGTPGVFTIGHGRIDLIKVGDGTQIFTNATSTFASTLDIYGGVVKFQGTAAMQLQKITFHNPGTELHFIDIGNNLRKGLILSGIGTLVIEKTGMTANSGASTYQAFVPANNSVISLSHGSLIDLRSGMMNMAGTGDVETGSADWRLNEATLRIGEYGRLDLRAVRVTVGGLEGSGVVVNSAFGNNLAAGKNGNVLTVGNGTLPGEVFTFTGEIRAGVETNTGGVSPHEAHAPIDLVKVGGGTQVFTKSVTSAQVTLRDGITRLNYTAAGAPAANILAPAASLALEGGTLEIIAPDAFDGVLQSFGSTTVTAPSTIRVDNTAGAVRVDIALGTLSLSGAMLYLEGFSTGIVSGEAVPGAVNFSVAAGIGDNDGKTLLAGVLLNGDEFASTAVGQGGVGV